MKILLVGINAKYSHQSLALKYIKNMCDDMDLSVKEFNINQQIDYIFGEIIKENPDIIGFSTYIWNLEIVQKLTSDLGQVLEGSKIIWGGPEASFDIDEHFSKNPQLDIIISGEGEITTKELFEKLDKNENIGDVKGISYRNNGEVFTNPDRPLIKNLDEIPSPYKDMETAKGKMVYFEMSRGCPFKCSYCLSSTIRGVRYFSEERIKSDIIRIIDSGAKVVKLVDRTFNANEKFSMKIMNFIKENAKEGMVFHMELMAHLISDEFLEYLGSLPKDLFQFEIGIQSSNLKTLEAIDRKADLDRLAHVVKTIASYGNIHQHVDLIAGLPYEDFDSFRESFIFADSLGAEKLQLGFLKLLRGSKIRSQVKEFDMKFNEYPPYEILSTKWINPMEMRRIKLIEDLVEKYSNEDYFFHTLKYLTMDSNNFDFFNEFSKYWERKNYHQISHSRSSLYKILYEYLGNREDIDVIIEVLRLDFLANHNQNPEKYLKARSIEMKYIHDLLRDEDLRSKFDLDLNRPTKFLVNKFRFEFFTFEAKERVYGIYYGKSGNKTIDVTSDYERILYGKIN